MSGINYVRRDVYVMSGSPGGTPGEVKDITKVLPLGKRTGSRSERIILTLELPRTLRNERTRVVSGNTKCTFVRKSNKREPER